MVVLLVVPLNLLEELKLMRKYKPTFLFNMLTHLAIVRYVTYFMDLVRMLRLHNVIPIIVFDGQELPMKLVINKTSAK